MTFRGWQVRASRRVGAWLLLVTHVGAGQAQAEDGYELWLRYHPLPNPIAATYRAQAHGLTGPDDGARRELSRGLSGLLGSAPVLSVGPGRTGGLVLGTPRSSALVLRLAPDVAGLPPEGYVIRSLTHEGRRVVLMAANDPAGETYAAFHFLRLLQTQQAIDHLDIREAPRVHLRMLDHWDNLDGTIERGYAGSSIWDWQRLPDYLPQRYTDYARACASIGLNATLLTNVNADALLLSAPYLRKTAALAGVLRRYGIRVFLAPRFSAPIELGKLATASPTDPAVRQWWQDKVAEIYRLIPDFGGFVVKASSEGQPGPADYGSTHAQGANLFADLLAPHQGVVLWRAFVYSDHGGEDRAKQAYEEFVPLDGQFHANVVLQVKNGPIDFQPREPAHPLFAAMPRTPMALELQITKEYLGFASHLVYLGPLFTEALQFDTHARGAGSTVARVVDGSLFGQALGAMAGVSNIGSDRNWTGSQFDQANWYAFGRLAWNPDLKAEDIATEWLRMTFSSDDRFVRPALAIMMGSREAAVDYMTPLGLTHLMAAGHHYGPGLWQGGLGRADWSPVYFHRADRDGIGFDRTASGSNAVAQYPEPLATQFGDVQQTPERYLLWFHHLSWDFRLASGRTLWEELLRHYTAGVQHVRQMRSDWQSLRPYVDAQRYDEVDTLLGIQAEEALWWRDASLAYFASIAQRPYPPGIEPPARSLAEYQSITTPYAPGNPGVTAAPFRH